MMIKNIISSIDLSYLYKFDILCSFVIIYYIEIHI